MNTHHHVLRSWLAASALLILAVVAAPAMAQNCTGFANSLAVDPASQTAQEFNVSSGYGPVTVTLTIKNTTSLPAGASLVWSQTGGPGVTLNTSNPLRPTFVAPSVGVAGATLGFSVQTRCNGTAAGNPALASVSVLNVDRPPVVTALALPPIVDVGNVVTLSATGSDPDGDSIAYTWTQISNGAPGVTLASPNAASTTFVAPTVPAETTFEFRVEGRSGTLAHSATVTVTVTAANLPPFAALSCPPIVDEGELFRLDGTASEDPEGALLTYEWFINEIEAGLAFSLDGETGDYVDRVAPSLGLGMAGGVVVRLRVSESPTVFTDATCAFMIKDATAPVLSLPAPAVLDAASAAGTQVTSYAVSALDNVEGPIGAASITCIPPAPHLFPLGPTTVDCNVSDTAGNGSSGSFLVTVADQSAPTLQPHDDVAVDATGPDGATVEYDDPIATDTVDATPTVACGPLSGSVFAIGSTVVTCSANDDAGNTSNLVTFTVAVHDTPPTLHGVSGGIAGVEATSPAGAPVNWAAPTATDAVDGSVTVICTPPSGSTFGLGTSAVTCSATDSANNVVSQGFNVTVVDTQPPVLSGVSDDITGVEATSPAGAIVTWTDPTAFDVVDEDRPVTCAPASGSAFALGTTNVTCSASDAGGRTASQSFDVTVVDTTAPVLSGVSDGIAGVEATSAAGAIVIWAAPSALDIVDGNRTVTCAPASGSTFALGTTGVTCSASDTRGNTASDSFDVTVVDTTAPVLSGVSDGIAGVEATSPAGATVTWAAPSALDIVDGNRTVTCAPASGSTFALGTTGVTCSASDTHGNSISDSFAVTVVDTTPPTLTLPGNLTPEATSALGAAVSFTATAVDLVSGSVAVDCTPASGSTFALNVATIVNCGATDGAGNTRSGSFMVTVRDTTAPTIAPHVDVTVNASGNSSAVVSYTPPTASDLVDGLVPVSCTPASGSTFNVGTTTVTCTAQDGRAPPNVAQSTTFKVIVNYTFNGFFQPIDNTATNAAKAGSAIPVKFSLGGNQGLNIFAANSPTSQAVACDSLAPVDEIETTVTAGGSTLQYDAGTGQYIYVWKTEKNWLGCRQLRITLRDGSTRTAMFKFR